MEREGSLDRGPVPAAAPSAAGRPLHRKRARKPRAASGALSLGILGDRDRPRPRAAKQVRAAPRRRRHAGRRAVRFSRAKPAARRRSRSPEAAAGQLVWLSLPARADNSREVSPEKAENAARFVSGAETIINSTSHLRIEEEIEVAYPRLAYEIRKTAKPGYVGLPIARIVEVHDRTLVFDEKFAPPVLICAAHPTVEGWLDRVIGWIGTKLDELARYASDPTAGGGMQSADYLMLQMLNREIPVLKHFRDFALASIPSGCIEEFLRIAGELATFATPERRAREYAPTLTTIWRARSRRCCATSRISSAPVWTGARSGSNSSSGRRNAYVSTIRDRTLFRNATLRARSVGAPAADRNPAEPARLSSRSARIPR